MAMSDAFLGLGTNPISSIPGDGHSILSFFGNSKWTLISVIPRRSSTVRCNILEERSPSHTTNNASTFPIEKQQKLEIIEERKPELVKGASQHGRSGEEDEADSDGVVVKTFTLSILVHIPLGSLIASLNRSNKSKEDGRCCGKLEEKSLLWKTGFDWAEAKLLVWKNEA